MSQIIKLCWGVTIWCLAIGFAAAASPLGNWTTIDDVTGKKRAVVRISQARDNTLNATIVRVYAQPGDINKCHKCSGRFKNKPIIGLPFGWGFKQTAANKWTGGRILDPKTGKIYHAQMTLKDNKLYVRGYIGISLIGRTQTWVR